MGRYAKTWFQWLMRLHTYFFQTLSVYKTNVEYISYLVSANSILPLSKNQLRVVNHITEKCLFLKNIRVMKGLPKRWNSVAPSNMILLCKLAWIDHVYSTMQLNLCNQVPKQAIKPNPVIIIYHTTSRTLRKSYLMAKAFTIRVTANH